MLMKGSRLIHLQATTRDNDKFLCKDARMNASGLGVEYLVLQEKCFPFKEYVIPQSLIYSGGGGNELEVRLFAEDLISYRSDVSSPGVLSLLNFEVPCTDADENCLCLMLGQKSRPTNSLGQLFNFRMEGLDGMIGPVEEVLLNAASMRVLYLVTSLRRAHSRRIVAPAEMIDRIDWGRRTLFLNVKKESLILDPRYYFEARDRGYDSEVYHGRELPDNFAESVETVRRIANF